MLANEHITYTSTLNLMRKVPRDVLDQLCIGVGCVFLYLLWHPFKNGLNVDGIAGNQRWWILTACRIKQAFETQQSHAGGVGRVGLVTRPALGAWLHSS